MIEVYVKNQYIEFIEKEVTTTNSLNYFKIHFSFDESWDKYVRHVTFFSTQKGERYVMQIKESNTVYVPNEVLKTNLPVYFGLYGENADGIRITTNTLQIPLVNSAYAPNSTVLDEDFVELRDFVKTEPDKIQYIREKDGVFEYSRDGVKWTQVRGKQGLGLPSGGEKDQYLVKSSINDYETEWKNFDNVVTEESNNGASSKAVATFVKEKINDYDILNQNAVNDKIEAYDEEIKSFIDEKDNFVKDFVVEKDNEIKNIIAQEDNKIKEFVIANDNQVKAFVEEEDNKVKALISKGDNEVKEIVANNYNELKTEQAKVIQSVKVNTVNGITELEKTNKEVTINLAPYLHTFKLNSLQKNVYNNSLTITDTELKDEIEKIISVANEGTNGFMSKEDKRRLNVLYSLLGEQTDADKVVNTIKEILAIFSQYPEGANLLNALNNKVDKIEGKGLSTQDFTTEEKIKLSSLPNNEYLENTYAKKQDIKNFVVKDGDKVLSTYDFNDFYKNKVNNSASKDDLQNYVSKSTKINGQELNKDLNIGTYRGYFQGNVSYYVGDLIEYGNEMWVCIASTAESQFNSSQWRLVSYKGVPTQNNLGLFSYVEKQKLENLPNNETLEKNYITKKLVEQTYVKKEEGKGLSSNDFTNQDKIKLNNAYTPSNINEALVNYVQNTRKINGKNLNVDINVGEYRGEYKPLQIYYVGDFVLNGNNIYICTYTHQTSSFNSDYWKLLVYHSTPNLFQPYGLFTNNEKTKLANLPTQEELNNNYALKTSLDNYVKKEFGKSLSTYDYTLEDKTKVQNSLQSGDLKEYVKNTLTINGQELKNNIIIGEYYNTYFYNKTYYKGDILFYNNALWYCTVTHKSNEFNTYYWTTLSYNQAPSEKQKYGVFTYTEKEKLKTMQEGATYDTAITETQINDLFS